MCLRSAPASLRNDFETSRGTSTQRMIHCCKYGQRICARRRRSEEGVAKLNEAKTKTYSKCEAGVLSSVNCTASPMLLAKWSTLMATTATATTGSAGGACEDEAAEAPFPFPLGALNTES